MNLHLEVIGHIRSSISDVEGPAKMENQEGAVRAVIELDPRYATAAEGLEVGMEIELFTWLHLGDRATLRVHPQGDTTRSKRGVFSTRSPSRPNPIGLHRLSVVSMESLTRFEVEPLEAVNGTPVIDIKIKPKGFPSWQTAG